MTTTKRTIPPAEAIPVEVRAAAAPASARVAEDSQRDQNVRQEYGQYVAIQPIEHNGVRAYNIGDPVPAGNVALYDYVGAGLVAAVSDPAAIDAKKRAASGSAG